MVGSWNPREFQATLRAFLDRRGWTESDLAKATGVSQAAINRWTRPLDSDKLAGVTQPTSEALAKLAPVIGLSHAELMRQVGRLHAEPSTNSHPPALTALVADVIIGWLAANPERRKVGEEVVRAALPPHQRRPRRRGRRGGPPESETPTIRPLTYASLLAS